MIELHTEGQSRLYRRLAQTVHTGSTEAKPLRPHPLSRAIPGFSGKPGVSLWRRLRSRSSLTTEYVGVETNLTKRTQAFADFKGLELWKRTQPQAQILAIEVPTAGFCGFGNLALAPPG